LKELLLQNPTIIIGVLVLSLGGIDAAPPAWHFEDSNSIPNKLVWQTEIPSYYATSPASDPRGPATGTTRTLRGGSWLDSAVTCRLTRRDSLAGSYASGDLGFRLVRSK
jgi:formylglycine-generating enzyme required for sulfatase activity